MIPGWVSFSKLRNNVRVGGHEALFAKILSALLPDKKTLHNSAAPEGTRDAVLGSLSSRMELAAITFEVLLACSAFKSTGVWIEQRHHGNEHTSRSQRVHRDHKPFSKQANCGTLGSNLPLVLLRHSDGRSEKSYLPTPCEHQSMLGKCWLFFRFRLQCGAYAD